MKTKEKIAINLDENWDIAKNEMLTYWGKLTEAQIPLIVDYESLSTQLAIAYQLNEEKIDIEIEKFMDKLGLIPFEIHLDQLKQALYQSTFAATSNLGRALQRSVNKMKGSSEIAQVKLSDYIRKNPLQSVAFALASGIFLNKLLSKIKRR